MNSANGKKIVILEEKIARVGRSTKTTIASFAPLHNWLRAHLGWYYRWHLNQFAFTAHKLFLVAVVLALGSVMLVAFGGGFILTILLLSLQ